MNTYDLLTRWSSQSIREIEAELETMEDDSTAEELLGSEELEDIREYIKAPSSRGIREAVVLLPGLMGSLLSSVRGVTSLLWINPVIFLKGQTSYLELSDDGVRDRHPEIDTIPMGIEKLVYLKIIIALDRQTDLFEFPYDWRRPIEWNGDLLKEYIDRWANNDPNQQFTLVGHSLGGLVSRAYIARHPEHAESRVKRLIMHGTPHFGAAGTVENLVLGNRMMAIVSKLNKHNETRRLIMNMPSIYQLLPSPRELFPSHRPYPVNWNLYRAESWQLEGIRQDYLDSGRAFHEILAASDPQIEIIEIAGCHQDTVVEVQRKSESEERTLYDLIRMDEGPDSGDATVPLWSAVLPRATIYYIQEIHRYLPRNKDVIDATLALIHGDLPNLPTVLPPRKTGWFTRDLLDPVDVEADNLRKRLEEGNPSEEDLSNLQFMF
jgi:pimeloyl-ACP methyl ester carboxylesterase